MRQRLARCACGQLRLQCQGEPLKVSLCHCLECQRRTGSSYGIAAFFRQEHVAASGITSNYTRTGESGHPVVHNFCPTCGATVFWQPAFRPGFVAVAVGAFADPDFPQPEQQVYTGTRHPWVAVDCRVR